MDNFTNKPLIQYNQSSTENQEEESQEFEDFQKILQFNLFNEEEDKKEQQIIDQKKIETQIPIATEQIELKLNIATYKNLSLQVQSIQSVDLERLEKFLSSYQIISKLKIKFNNDIFDQEIQIQQFISILSKINILKQLTIEVIFSKLINYNIINFAIEICKKNQIESFKLILKQDYHYNTIYSFEIFSNSDNGQSVVQQLELIKSKLKKQIYSYSILSRILHYSQGVLVRKFFLDRQKQEFAKLNYVQEILLSKQISRLHQLDKFKYHISFYQNNYEQIFSLNLIISSIKNLKNLNLYLTVYIDQSKDSKNNGEINTHPQQYIQFIKQQKNELLKIRKNSTQNENIKQAQITIVGQYNKDIDIDTEKINTQFRVNLFEQIIWSINKVLDLQINVPQYLLEYLSNEVHQWQQLQTFKFRINCQNLNHEFTDKLGINLQKLQNLKKLSLEIDIFKDQSEGPNISHNFINAPVQKEIIVRIDSDDKGLVNKKVKIFKQQGFEQIKEIFKLNNIYFFQFNFQGYEGQIFALFKSIIKLAQNLQTIKFLIGRYSNQQKYIAWDTKQKNPFKTNLYKLGLQMQIRNNKINQTSISIFKNQNILKKCLRLVKIDSVKLEE